MPPVAAAFKKLRDMLVMEWLSTRHGSIEEAYVDAMDRLAIIVHENPAIILKASKAIHDELPEGTHTFTISQAKEMLFDAVSRLVPASATNMS